MRDAISLQSMSAPAASRPCASATTSGHSDPPSTKSSIESRNMMMNLGSTAARIRSTIARGRRVRFVYVPNEGDNQWQLPPHSSVRHQWQSVGISGNYPPTRPSACSYAPR